MLEAYYKLVDEAISALGLNPEETKGQQPGQWNLKKGKFDILVDVWEQENHFLFQIVSPLCSLPDENKEAFMLHLLQKNYGLSSLAYSIMDDSVFLKHTTEMHSLTKENIVSLLSKTAFYAEQSEFVPNEN
jgi:hypothetical protein